MSLSSTSSNSSSSPSVRVPIGVNLSASTSSSSTVSTALAAHGVALGTIPTPIPLALSPLHQVTASSTVASRVTQVTNSTSQTSASSSSPAPSQPVTQITGTARVANAAGPMFQAVPRQAQGGFQAVPVGPTISQHLGQARDTDVYSGGGTAKRDASAQNQADGTTLNNTIIDDLYQQGCLNGDVITAIQNQTASVFIDSMGLVKISYPDPQNNGHRLKQVIDLSSVRGGTFAHYVTEINTLLNKTYKMDPPKVGADYMGNKNGSIPFENAPARNKNWKNKDPDMKLLKKDHPDNDKDLALRKAAKRLKGMRKAHEKLKEKAAANVEAHKQEIIDFKARTGLATPADNATLAKMEKRQEALEARQARLNEMDLAIVGHALAYSPVALGASLEKRIDHAKAAVKAYLTSIEKHRGFNFGAITNASGVMEALKVFSPFHKDVPLYIDGELKQEEKMHASLIYTMFFNTNDPATAGAEKAALKDLLLKSGLGISAEPTEAKCIYDMAILMEHGQVAPTDKLLRNTDLPVGHQELISQVDIDDIRRETDLAIRSV